MSTIIFFHQWEDSADYTAHIASTVPEYLPVSTMQQQQTEQMRVYWKVNLIILFFSPVSFFLFIHFNSS